MALDAAAEKYDTSYRNMASALVLTLLIIENYDPSMGVYDIMEEIVHRGSDHLKNMDACRHDCERSLIRFFSKRTSCSCLNKRLTELKY